MIATQYEKFTEREIIDKVLNGEKALYEIIIRRFNPYLYKIGRSYNYNHDDTQDLMQETYIDVYKNLASFEGRSQFKTWIVRIMINNCYKKKEKLSVKNEVMQAVNEYSTPMFSNSNLGTEKVIHNRELGNVIEKALSKIPVDYRMVFSLREINGMNVAETAELLEISETNVKVRLNRAKTMLQEEIKKSYVAAELFEFNLIYCNAIVDRVMAEIFKL
ncbi:MAG: sigma-70 family RNA polymerase sigma factor [Chitinophagales bacterium]|nr:sigma-70 family RNA polymerase sigma factor [Bacteroidota bacterium]